MLPKYEHDFCENFKVSKAYPQETQHADMLSYCCLNSPRKPLRPLIGKLLNYLLRAVENTALRIREPTKSCTHCSHSEPGQPAVVIQTALISSKSYPQN